MEVCEGLRQTLTVKSWEFFVMRWVVFFLCCPLPILCQSNSGELRLKVTDPSGLGGISQIRKISATPFEGASAIRFDRDCRSQAE
jgi:hypothetical protein